MGIPENIKRIREAHELSQDDLGKIAGVTGKAVSTWENGTKQPRMGAIQKMADHFGIQKSDIIEDNDGSALINNDPELTAYLEELKNRKEMRMLFSLAAGATKEDVEKSVKIIEALLGKKADDE